MSPSGSPPDSRRNSLPAKAALLVAVFAAAALCGWGASRLGVPLAWLLGALVASMAFALAGARVEVGSIRSYGLVVLGLALGQSFTPAIMAEISTTLPLIALCGVGTLAAGLPVAPLFRRMAGLDPATSFFCAIPGGVVLMAVQAQRAGASEQHVVLAQSVRLVVVVLIYPALIALFVPHHAVLTEAMHASIPVLRVTDLPEIALLLAAGVMIAQLARRSILPNPWMIAPCLMTIALNLTGLEPVPLPSWLITICQLILGVSLGSRMTPDFVLGSGRLLLASVLSSLFLIAVLVPAAVLVAYMSGLDLAAVLFGLSPGGMPEMTVAARAAGAAVPLVLSFHLTRILICNLALEPAWHLLARRRLARRS